MAMPNPEPTLAPPQPTAEEIAAQKEAEREQRKMVITIAAVVIVLLALFGVALYFLLRPQTAAEDVGRIRDVFIIVVALESLLIGVALIVLMLQLASLINLLQNEVKPILAATTETVNNLRGTAEFLGENVVEPVIKLNGYLAGLQRVLELMRIKK